MVQRWIIVNAGYVDALTLRRVSESQGGELLVSTSISGSSYNNALSNSINCKTGVNCRGKSLSLLFEPQTSLDETLTFSLSMGQDNKLYNESILSG